MLARKISSPKAMASKLKVFISRKTTHFLEKFCISWTTTTCRKSRSVLQHGKMFDETHFLVECFEKFRQNVVKRTCSTLTKFPNKEFLLLTNDRYGPLFLRNSL